MAQFILKGLFYLLSLRKKSSDVTIQIKPLTILLNETNNDVVSILRVARALASHQYGLGSNLSVDIIIYVS